MHTPVFSATISDSTLQALQSKQIKTWQASLRENIPLEKLLENPNIAALHEPAPECAPAWAGGSDKIGTGNDPTWEECVALTEGSRTGNLLPFEAVMQFGLKPKVANEILKSLEQAPPRHPIPAWIPSWAHCYRKNGRPPKKATPAMITPFPLKTASVEVENQEDFSPWTETEVRNLKHYWKLELLGVNDISHLLSRPPADVLAQARKENLPKKEENSQNKDWCGVNWEFKPDSPGDPKYLDSTTQHMVAETSATRFSLLYEVLQDIEETAPTYQKIQRELDKILRIHTRIFDKFLNNKSRKYNQMGLSPVLFQQDLEQAGRSAIFECLRRWHPDRGIRFSRGTICLTITREMIAWVESQRLVEIPDKIRSVARKLRRANDRGEYEAEYERLATEAGENCVREAAKHQNTYAFISTVPIMDSYSEEEAEAGGRCAGNSHSMAGFETCHNPDQNIDAVTLILEASKRLTPEERRATLAYHGITESGDHVPQKTLEEIGAMEGVTKERIRQRIAKAMERLKRWMESRDIRCTSDAYAAA